MADRLPMSRMLIKYLTVPLLLSLLASCSFHAIYDENVGLDGARWAYDRAARFEVPVQDTTQSYNFYINIRNDNSYRYSNLFVFMTTHFPNGNVTRDTIEFVLADNSGKWLGRGWGRIKEHKIMLRENLRFPVTGTYRFMIQQAMRDDTLSGITDVGLIIERTD